MSERRTDDTTKLYSFDTNHKAKLQTATFAAGCFWGVEAVFRKLIGKGIVSTSVGYTGGEFPNPTYEDVHSRATGHLEAVQMTFDPARISYSDLLDVFWKMHNPARADGQGVDIGPQYRAAIFYHTPEQRREAEESKLHLEKSGPSGGRIVTKILAAKEFYPAEDYHQQYYENHGNKAACPAF